TGLREQGPCRRSQGVASYRGRHEADAGTASQLSSVRSEGRMEPIDRLCVIRLASAAASAGAPPAGRHRRSFAEAALAATVRRPAPAEVAVPERPQSARAGREGNRNMETSAFAPAGGGAGARRGA